MAQADRAQGKSLDRPFALPQSMYFADSKCVVDEIEDARDNIATKTAGLPNAIAKRRPMCWQPRA
jgi:hypothetical protein